MRFYRGIQWIVGDVLLGGERLYGEAYSQVLDAAGYEHETLKACQWVSHRFGMVRRRTIPSWTHHKEVCGTDPAIADQILNRVENEGLSTRAVRALAKAANQPPPTYRYVNPRGCTVDDLHALAASGRRFGCIYADPPWRYDNAATRGAAGDHYDTMTVEEMAALPVGSLAADACHLHLWTTNAFLFECPKLFAAWGFDYQGTFVWCKSQMGMGNCWRVSHEILLLATRGDARRFQNNALWSYLVDDRGEHSAKPEKVRLMIEKASPGPYLELFARVRSDPWLAWGNDIDRDLWNQDLARGEAS